VSLTLGYLGVHGEHLTRTRDINLFPSVPAVGALASGGAVTYLTHPGAGAPARPNAAFGRIAMFDNGGDSVYNGGFIQLTKRFAENFQLLASYTFSKVLDTVPDATAVTVGGGDDAKQAQDSLLPNLDRARGNANTTHRFVFSGVWDINYAKSLENVILKGLLSGWQLATIAQLQSGRYYSPLVSGDPNNDGNLSTDRFPGVGRNTILGPNFESVDLRISRDIPVA